ncbi:hypothetical protein Hanom_Chr07g00618741 [Helianthus anomalus]
MCKRVEEENGSSHMSKAHLLQVLADAKLELSTLLASPPEKNSGTIKEQLAAIAPNLEQF